jgi:hypothetical protein
MLRRATPPQILGQEIADRTLKLEIRFWCKPVGIVAFSARSLAVRQRRIQTQIPMGCVAVNRAGLRVRQIEGRFNGAPFLLSAC